MEDEHSQGTHNPDEFHQESYDELYEPEVEGGLSPVASLPAKNIAVLVIIVIILIGTIYYMFFAPEPVPKSQQQAAKPVETGHKLQTQEAPKEATEPLPPVMPAIPPMPQIEMPTPPAPVAPAPVQAAPAPAPSINNAALPQLPFGNAESQQEAEEAKQKAAASVKSQREARVKAPMMGGGPGAAGAGAINGAGNAAASALGSKDKKAAALEAGVNDAYNNDDDFTPAHTGASQVLVTKIGNTRNIIGQGKLIDAVLETAINTDLPGSLRAIISRDVYAEAGQTVLIPKGSRLIGTYSSDIARGQKRVQVTWGRLIMPNGTDINIDSQATDQLGRTGLTGDVDNKYSELFSTAILTSVITAGVAIVADRASGNQTSSTSTTTGAAGTTTTTTGSATNTAISNSVTQAGNIASGITSDYLNVNPTITVDQGTKVIVYVNHDLIFPASTANNIDAMQ